MVKKGKVTDIRARQLQAASELLQPTLEKIYDKYGLDLSLTVLMWFAARGCLLGWENKLTEKQENDLIEQCHQSLDSSVLVVRAERDNGDAS